MEGGGKLSVRRVAANRASTDTGSVEGGGKLSVRCVAANRASTDTGSVEGAASATLLKDITTQLSLPPARNAPAT